LDESSRTLLKGEKGKGKNNGKKQFQGGEKKRDLVFTLEAR